MLQAFAPVDVVRVVELVGIVGIGYLGLRIQNAVGQIRLACGNAVATPGPSPANLDALR